MALWSSGNLQNGDTVLVDACTYANDFNPNSGTGDVSISANDIYVTAVSSSGCTAPDPWNGGNPSHPLMALVQQTANAIAKGLWNVDGNDVTIDHIAFTGAQADSSDTNGAGIRIENSGNTTIQNDYFYANEDGILGFSTGGTITINNSEFYDNGLGGCVNDCTHNLYVTQSGSTLTPSLVVTNSYFHDLCVTDPNGYCASGGVGNELKSRAASSTINGARIFDNMSGASYETDLPQSGTILIENSVIEQGPNTQNPIIVDTGVSGNDGTLNPSTGITVTGNTFVNDFTGGGVVAISNGSPTTAQVSGNSWYGLTSSQLTSGPVNLGTNTTLSTRPTLDTTSPVGQ
jgi:hypothetical protein